MLAPANSLLRAGIGLKLNQIKLATRSYLRDRTNQASGSVTSYAVAAGLFAAAGIFLIAACLVGITALFRWIEIKYGLFQAFGVVGALLLVIATICAAVAEHELHVQKGMYENLVKTQAKYSQNELAIRTDPRLRRQWARIKAAFNVQAYCDHKGVIRRTMSAERNLRPSFSVNVRRRDDVFHAAFDAFCLRWNLYGMQHDEPLLLKLAVNLTPYGTLIHIPAYWSFDPKRDIRWDAIAKLHRVRVPGRQGNALAEGLAERMKSAGKLHQLDKEVLRLGLKGGKKHAFLCDGLGLVTDTSHRRISRLRAEFKHQPPVAKAK